MACAPESARDGRGTAQDLGAYLSFPRFSLRDRRRALRALVDCGEVAVVSVKGAAGSGFALKEDLAALRETGPARRGLH